ncbi:DnaJ domain [Arabidopsis suecica]|uniref:DnaJ domain n=1 Tax=Arabidopsis suecica TaxID=45249 RepID=A0A8T2BSD5_ARASU|nr:DnaJ domain [Arabidopsis suecica]
MDRYHPDTNANNLEASDLYKEVALCYSILSDPKKRWQYDYAGFEAIEANYGMDMEIDLADLGTIDTVFAALFSKLCVSIKTSVPANVLEEARNGTFTHRPLSIGTSVSGKVDKHCAHFFRVTISEQPAESGVVVRVTSTEQSKFKLLYFQQVLKGGYGLALQLVEAKDPESALFKRLEALQPCDNFFKSTSYTIEALCAKTYEDTIEKLKEIEAQVLRKRDELRQFETEYRKALARFQEVTNRYSREKQTVDELLKQRNSIRSTFSVMKSRSGNNLRNGSSSKAHGDGSKGDVDSAGPKSKNRTKRKWFNFNLIGYDYKKLD